MAGREPTERDHFPVDAAIGRYSLLVLEYIAHVRSGEYTAAEDALMRAEVQRKAMVATCRRFNERFPVREG